MNKQEEAEKEILERIIRKSIYDYECSFPNIGDEDNKHSLITIIVRDLYDFIKRYYPSEE